MRRVWSPLAAVFLGISLLSSFAFAAPRSLPADVTVLTHADFAGKPNSSVADVLRGVTSLKVEQDGSHGTRAIVKMRGLSSAADVLILLDGRSISDEYDGTVDLTQISIGFVDRIEITRGGASVVYSGQAVAGTINIVTIRPEEKGMWADLHAGVARDGVKDTRGLFRVRSNYGDLTYAPSRDYSGGFSANENMEATGHFGNFTRSFKGKGFWGAEYNFQNSFVGVSNGTPYPFNLWDTHIERAPTSEKRQRFQETQHAKAFLAYPLLAGTTGYVTFTRGWHLLEERPKPEDGELLFDEHNRVSRIDFQMKTKRSTLGYDMRSIHQSMETAGGGGNVEQHGFYGTTQWTGQHWQLTPGVRYDQNSRTGGAWVPRLAALVEPFNAWTFSASAQTAHRSPELNQLFVTDSVQNNKDLKDEKSVSWDAGAVWAPAERFDVKTTYFAIRKRDLITVDSSSRWTNDGDEKSNGVEGEMNVGLLSCGDYKTDLIAGGTLQESMRRTSMSNGRYLRSAMTPRKFGHVQLDQYLPRKMILTNELYYQSEQFEFDDKAGVRVPDFYTWNARISFRILTADMYFAAHNLLNHRYAEAVASSSAVGGPAVSGLIPQPGITFWVGATIRFIN